MSSASPWPQEYYNALRFYYWEPQLLNRHANAKRQDRTCAEVMGNVARSEVSLNHLLNIFFNLAPAALTARFFGRYLRGWSPERLESHVRPTLSVAPSIDLCQTDFLFLGRDSIVAMEMKVKHKTSVKQAVKYALFMHHYGQSIGGTRRRPYLLYLSPSEDRVWEHGLTFGSFAAALDSFELSSTIKQFADLCGHSRADVLAIAAAMPLSHATYQELGGFLAVEAAALDGSEGGETLRNLIGGVLDELAARGLVAGQPEAIGDGVALTTLTTLATRARHGGT